MGITTTRPVAEGTLADPAVGPTPGVPDPRLTVPIASPPPPVKPPPPPVPPLSPAALALASGSTGQIGPVLVGGGTDLPHVLSLIDTYFQNKAAAPWNGAAASSSGGGWGNPWANWASFWQQQQQLWGGQQGQQGQQGPQWGGQWGGW